MLFRSLVIHPLKARTIADAQLAAAQIAGRMDDYIAVQNQLSQRILSNRAIFAYGELTKPAAQDVEALNRTRALSNVMFQAVGPSQNIRDIVLYDLGGEEVASYIGYYEPPPLAPLLRDPDAVRRLKDSAYVIYAEPGEPVSFVRSIIDRKSVV